MFTHGTDNGDRIMKAVKLTNGQVVALIGDGGLLNDPRVVRLDAQGKELHAFSVRMRVWSSPAAASGSTSVLTPLLAVNASVNALLVDSLSAE